MSLARRILGNTFAQVVGRFATALLAVIVVKILTVYLGQSGYGKYATIYEFLAFFGAFADFGIFTIAVREMSKDKAKEAAIFGNALVLRTIFTTGALLLAAIAVWFIPQYQGTVIPVGVAIAALSTFFVIMSGTFSAALQMRLRMEVAAFALILGKVFTVLAIVAITKWWFPDMPEESFVWLIWAGTIGGALTFALTALMTMRIFPVRIAFDPKLIKRLLVEAAPFAVALALNTFYLRMDILLLSLFLPITTDGVCAQRFCGDTEVGSYAVAARMVEIVIMVPIYFMNSVLPTLTRSLTEKSQQAAHVLTNAFAFLLAVGLPAGILMITLSREIVRIVASEEFLSTATSAGSDTAIRILGLMIPIAFISMFFGFLLIAIGKQSTLIWINLGAVTFNLLADMWAIPHYGFVGAAYASLISEFVMISLMALFAYRTYAWHPPAKNVVRTLLSAAIAGAVAFGAHQAVAGLGSLLSLLVTTTVFTMCYYFALRRLGIITPEILRMLKKSPGRQEIQDV